MCSILDECFEIALRSDVATNASNALAGYPGISENLLIFARPELNGERFV